LKKKLHTLFFSLLVLVYITTNIGVCVYYHYCGGELEKVSALVKVKSCCDGVDENSGSDCCKNESRHISLKLEFNTAKASQPDFAVPFSPLFSVLSPGIPSLQKDQNPAFSFASYAQQRPPNALDTVLTRTGVFRI
jgi:hypothetical protein